MMAVLFLNGWKYCNMIVWTSLLINWTECTFNPPNVIGRSELGDMTLPSDWLNRTTVYDVTKHVVR